jgi:hypothetical protein
MFAPLCEWAARWSIRIAAPRFSTGVARAASIASSASRRRVADLEASTKARFEAAPPDGKLRRFKEFLDGAQSRSRVERIIARVVMGAEWPETRFAVTNLRRRNARALCEDVYCRRGPAENHFKSWTTHLAADRTSRSKATASPFRLFPHAGAYWLMWGFACRCQSVRCGASLNSTPRAFVSSRSPLASSRRRR